MLSLQLWTTSDKTAVNQFSCWSVWHISVFSQSQTVLAWKDCVPLVMGESATGAGASDQPTLRAQQSCDLAICGPSESAAVGR